MRPVMCDDGCDCMFGSKNCDSNIHLSHAQPQHHHNTIHTLHACAGQPAAQSTSVLPESSHKPYLCRASIMPSTKKADLIQQLKEHGEEAHDKMTVIEIKARLEVLKGDSPKTEVGTLEARLKEMYTRSRDRKSQFQKFLQDRGITFSEHATVVQMVAAAERQITEEFEVNGAEKMNFGKFSSMTMDNVIEDHPSYAQWCHQTAAESDTASWRLQRFARYMTMKQAKSSIEYQYQQTGTMGHKTIPDKDKAAKADGYLKGKKPSPSASSQPSVESFSLVGSASVSSGTADRLLTDEAKEIARLKAELLELKSEKAEMEQTLSRNKGRREM